MSKLAKGDQLYLTKHERIMEKFNITQSEWKNFVERVSK